MVAYTFDGSEGKPIALATAKEWAANYRASLINPDDILAQFFGLQIIKKLLAEPSCIGVRIYYGLDSQGKKQLILVGANAQGENLLPASMALDSADPITVADFSFPCPPYCPPNGL